MKLGTIHNWGDDVQLFRDEVRLAEKLGYDVVGVGDSPAAWHDVYASLMIAAQVTERVKLAPMVTGPFIRHPLVTANALSTLDEISGGRVRLGFAAGGSLMLAVGRGLAKQSEIREYVATLRQLFRGETSSFEGMHVSPLRFPREIPIYFSAKGPKNLRLAGEIADGVIIYGGSDLEKLEKDIAAVREGAVAAGRKPDKVDIWVFAYTAVRETRALAMQDIKAFLVASGRGLRSPEALAKVPTQFRGKIEELHRRYDFAQHAVDGGSNVALMEELGLTEYLAEYYTVIGSPDEVRSILDGYARLGVSTFFNPLVGNSDKLGTMRRLAEAMGKQPAEV